MTTGALLIPSCVREAKKISIPLDHLKLTSDHETLMASITETLLPTSDTPGSKELKLHEFVLRMMDDCYSPEEQKEFQAGLERFNSFAEKTSSKSFSDMSAQERKEFLTVLETNVANEASDDDDEKSVLQFYSRTKSLSVRGYMNSEPVMSNLTYYKMVPGRFDGCVEIKDPSDYKTIYG